MPPPFFRRSQSVLTTAAELAAAEQQQQQQGSTGDGGAFQAHPPSGVVIRKSKSFKRIRGLLKVASSESRRERRAARKASGISGHRGNNAVGDEATTPTATNLSSITAGTTNDTPFGGSSTNVADSSFISNVSGNMSMLPDMDDVSTINYYGVDVDDRSVITQTNVTNNLFGTVPGNNSNFAGSTTDERLGREVSSSYSTTTNHGSSSNNNNFILKVVLLLMDPETRRFELLQLEFDSLKALVSDVLAQIPISVTEESLRQQQYTSIANQYSVEMTPPTKLLASFCKGNEVLVAIPNHVPVMECIRLARPILSDENVVSMLHSSGIDASGWKEDPLKKKKKNSTLQGTAGQGYEDDIPVQAEPMDHHIKSASSKSGSVLFTIVCMIFIGLVVQIFHIYISAPINVGSTISPGVWLSKCGLFSLVPSYCDDNAYVHFHRNGTVSYYNSEKVTVWTMEGGVCPGEIDYPTPPNAPHVVPCIQGMHIQNDGKIMIGGKVIYHVITYGNSIKKEPPLSPWPFVEPPKLKVWRK